jgi:peptidoglycan hydrolase-like protein with peptidoglycan-binding domain
VHDWQQAHGMPVSDAWSPRNWMSLLADGPTPVVKIGSAGGDVRRLQRALNASGHAALPVRGVFDTGTQAAVRRWQRAADVAITGVVARRQWQVLQSGRR